MTPIGHRLKAARISAGKTQQQVAAELGVTNQRISAFERGVDKLARNPGFLARYAEAIKMPVEEMMERGDG